MILSPTTKTNYLKPERVTRECCKTQKFWSNFHPLESIFFYLFTIFLVKKSVYWVKYPLELTKVRICFESTGIFNKS